MISSNSYTFYMIISFHLCPYLLLLHDICYWYVLYLHIELKMGRWSKKIRKNAENGEEHKENRSLGQEYGVWKLMWNDVCKKSEVNKSQHFLEYTAFKWIRSKETMVNTSYLGSTIISYLKKLKLIDLGYPTFHHSNSRVFRVVLNHFWSWIKRWLKIKVDIVLSSS